MPSHNASWSRSRLCLLLPAPSRAHLPLRLTKRACFATLTALGFQLLARSNRLLFPRVVDVSTRVYADSTLYAHPTHDPPRDFFLDAARHVIFRSSSSRARRSRCRSRSSSAAARSRRRTSRSTSRCATRTTSSCGCSSCSASGRSAATCSSSSTRRPSATRSSRTCRSAAPPRRAAARVSSARRFFFPRRFFLPSSSSYLSHARPARDTANRSGPPAHTHHRNEI